MRREHFALFQCPPSLTSRGKVRLLSSEPSNGLAAIRVVYVEDDERLARLTAQYPNSHGVEVTRVARGDQAWRRCCAFLPMWCCWI
jgi:hypothetical protein